MNNILQEMLLIQEVSIFRLYKELTNIATYFIAPVFTIALILEYFGEMNFGEVVKKLLLITVFIGAFYNFHSKAIEISLESASYTLKKVSPRNLFVKKWYHTKVRTSEKSGWNSLQSFAIPNLNDLLATAFFLLAKVFLWLLKLIYSSVYHFTYVFSGVTAILYFLGWTKDALKGTVQASLWCMIMPFVIVAILALVGNSIEESALGGELIVAKVDTIIWLFGVTLLLLISPLITFGMIKGDGIHSFGSKMGTMVVSSGLKTMALLPFITKMKDRFSGKNLQSKYSGFQDKSKNTSDRKHSSSKVENDKNRASTHKENNRSKEFKEGESSPKGSREFRLIQKRGELKPEKSSGKGEEFVKLQKQNFKFNQKYWDSINPHKAAAIKEKYGIKGNRVDPNKVHRPAKVEGTNNQLKTSRTQKQTEVSRRAAPSRKHAQLACPQTKERSNELRRL